MATEGGAGQAVVDVLEVCLKVEEIPADLHSVRHDD